MAKWDQAIAPVIDTYMQEMTQKGLTMDELKERLEFIRTTRDELIKEQKAKGIPMPYAE